jgi:hypothetical protein
MATYRLIAVKADGTGDDHSWGDTYEVKADDYLAAEADVLGRQGTDGTQPYARIVKGWVKDGWRWTQLPACECCNNAIAMTQWAGTGQMICWACCEAKQAGRLG